MPKERNLEHITPMVIKTKTVEEIDKILNQIQAVVDKVGYVSVAQICIIAGSDYDLSDFQSGWFNVDELQLKTTGCDSALVFPPYHYTKPQQKKRYAQ